MSEKISQQQSNWPILNEYNLKRNKVISTRACEGSSMRFQQRNTGDNNLSKKSWIVDSTVGDEGRQEMIQIQFCV